MQQSPLILSSILFVLFCPILLYKDKLNIGTVSFQNIKLEIKLTFADATEQIDG